ncbi:MAG: hypothetical protein N3E41_08815, partial [Thermofilaceae archaeon]|nr:hypothetical protein [Thermofilaceae archaeon]
MLWHIDIHPGNARIIHDVILFQFFPSCCGLALVALYITHEGLSILSQLLFFCGEHVLENFREEL